MKLRVSDNLSRDLRVKVPVSQLRVKYNPEDVANIPRLELYKFIIFDDPPRLDNHQWFLDVFAWFFDECRITLSATIMPFGFEKDDLIAGNIFDVVTYCYFGPHKGPLMHFLAKRGVKPNLKPGKLLACCQSAYEAHILFDMGAIIEPDIRYQKWIFLVETSRQVARAKIKALIHGAERLPACRWIAPNVVRLIGKMIWASRWNDFKPLK